jgi:Immunoglobulin-like domain of bacterial spore germination
MPGVLQRRTGGGHMLARMRRLLTSLALALLAGGMLAPQAPAALTAREIRIGDHPGFVRVVVEFTGGRVIPGEVVATDPNPFPDGFVRLPLTRRGVRTTAAPVRDHGVFARIAQTSGRRITIRLTGDDRRFKYVGYFAERTPQRLVLDLHKARPPSDAAEIVRGRGGCLRLTEHNVTRERVTAEGRERDLFEHSLVVRLRRNDGRIHRQQAETAFRRMWSTDFTYSPTRRQTGTLEAVALSAKDGTLDCLVQVRVRMGGG